MPPDTGDFRIKARLTTPGGPGEHLWLAVARRDGDDIVGVLVNDPATLDDVQAGDEIRVDADRLSDWAYFKHGKMFGAFTMRAVLDRLSPGERARYLDVLSEDPVEADAF